MPEEVLTVVRIPIAEIEESLRTKHVLPKTLKDVHIDGNSLVFHFGDDQGSIGESAIVSPFDESRRHRVHRRRNRMKTRGWDIIARMTNSKGQKCAVYKPFVDALRDSKLSSEEQRAVVEKILKSNRNRPTEVSVQYFLGNSLEYLGKQESSKEKPV